MSTDIRKNDINAHYYLLEEEKALSKLRELGESSEFMQIHGYVKAMELCKKYAPELFMYARKHNIKPQKIALTAISIANSRKK